MAEHFSSEGYAVRGSRVRKKRLSIDDFERIRVIGTGHYSIVVFVKKRSSGNCYAMKIMDKRKIIKGDDVPNIISERELMQLFKHPFVIGLRYAFQDPDSLYLVMDFAQGGELFTHLKLNVRFSEARVRFYAAEVFLAIRFLHQQSIIYRDLKPENVLVGADGHIVLCDFGLSKSLREQHDKTRTWCGTPEYLAPEVLLDSEEAGYTMSIDWWAFGVLVYEMLVGITPFYDENVNKMYEHIVYRKVSFPRSSRLRLSRDVQDLIKRLLTRHPQRRLGSRTSDDIKNHPWFQGLDWAALARKELPPPFVPELDGKEDLRYIDKEFLGMPMVKTTGAGSSASSNPSDGRPPRSGNIIRAAGSGHTDGLGRIFYDPRSLTSNFENFSYSGSYSSGSPTDLTPPAGFLSSSRQMARTSLPQQEVMLTGSGSGSLVDRDAVGRRIRQARRARGLDHSGDDLLDDLDAVALDDVRLQPDTASTRSGVEPPLDIDALDSLDQLPTPGLGRAPHPPSPGPIDDVAAGLDSRVADGGSRVISYDRTHANINITHQRRV